MRNPGPSLRKQARLEGIHMDTMGCHGPRTQDPMIVQAIHHPHFCLAQAVVFV